MLQLFVKKHALLLEKGGREHLRHRFSQMNNDWRVLGAVHLPSRVGAACNGHYCQGSYDGSSPGMQDAQIRAMKNKENISVSFQGDYIPHRQKISGGQIRKVVAFGFSFEITRVMHALFREKGKELPQQKRQEHTQQTWYSHLYFILHVKLVVHSSFDIQTNS